MKTSNTNGYVGYDLKYELLVQEDITYISHEETFAHTNERLNIIIIYHIRNKRSPRIIDSKNCVQKKLKQENMILGRNIKVLQANKKKLVKIQMQAAL